jgi:hypothetical protein
MTSDVIEQDQPVTTQAETQAEVPATETPASDEQPQQQEQPQGDKLTPEQRRLKQLQRTVDRRTERLGALARETEILRERLAQFEQQNRPAQPEQDEEQPRLTADDIERLATERARELRQQETVRERAAAVMQSGKKLDGFDEAVNAVAEEVPFTDRKGRPTPFIEAVLDADKPAEILHWLGKNPDEAAKFATLTPAQIGRHLAKLEDQIAREAKDKTSGAPKPLEPLRGGAKGEKEPSSMTDAEFAAWRKAQIAKRG